MQVVNLSLGHRVFSPAKDDPLVRAVEKCPAAGLIVVASAGNYGQNRKTGVSGYTGLTSPGNAPSALTLATLRAHRLQARASLQNGRGNEARRKLGAAREGFLRKSFLRHGEYHDQAVWTILAEERVDAFSLRILSIIH